MYKLCIRFLVIASLVWVASCAVQPDSDDVALALPSYASFIGYSASTGQVIYTVSCPLRTVLVLEDNIERYFYNADGSQKAWGDFCDEHDSSTRIQR